MKYQDRYPITNECILQLELGFYKSNRLQNLDTRYKDKVRNIAKYIDNSGLKSVVIGVSGGIDSALVLAMLHDAQNRSKSKFKIIAVCITFGIYENVFEQSYIEKLKSFYSSSACEFHQLDMTEAHASIWKSNNLIHTIEDEANVSYALRYTQLFAFAQANRGMTFGTTNLDEFGFVGWFGKTSDMVVDVHPIMDFHKFEVLECAKAFTKIPKEIINRAPTGDLIDEKTDEESFGCSYDELSFLTAYMKSGCKPTDFMKSYFKKAFNLHEQNKHKYQGQGFNPVRI